MTKTETLIADLEEASRIAKAGEDTPLLGGPTGLMWGVLLTLIFGYQYVVLGNKIDVPEITLMYAWIAYGVVGGIGSYVLNRQMKGKPGATSVANRVEQYVWTMFVGALAAIIIGTVLNMLFGNGNQSIWNVVLPFAFAGQGIAYGVTAKISGQKIMHIASFLAMSFAAISMMVVTEPVVYLVGSIGSFVTIVIPSLISMKQAG